MIRSLAILLALSAASCGGESAVVICESGTALACRCDDGRLGTSQCIGGDQFDACDCTGGTGTGGSSSTGSSGCSNDLSNIGTADFHISLRVATTQHGMVALVNQRNICGLSSFWDLRLSEGNVLAETDDDSSYATLTGTIPVNDGNPHVVGVSRVAATLTIEVDGDAAGSTASEASFAALAPLVVGTDICKSVDQTADFVGTLGTVCVTSP